MKRNVCYQFRTNICPIPYYYYPDTKETLWKYKREYTIVEPIEGKFCSPPSEPVKATYVNSSLVSTFAQRNISNLPHQTIFSEESLITIENAFLSPITAEKSEFSLSFLQKPFLSSDSFLVMDSKVLYETISASINFENFVESGYRKNPIKPEQVFLPGRKVLIGSILKSTDRPDLAKNFIRTCKHFISKPDESEIPDLFQKLNGHPSLLSEIIIFLIFQTNSRNLTAGIRNAWRLLLILISKFNFYEMVYQSDQQAKSGSSKQFDIILILKSYLVLVASEQKVSSKNITKYAILCLLRLSCKETPILDYNDQFPSNFVHMCESTKRLFGFSLGEIICKENLFLLGSNKKGKHTRAQFDLTASSNSLFLSSFTSTYFGSSTFNLTSISSRVAFHGTGTLKTSPIIVPDDSKNELSLVPKVVKILVDLIKKMDGFQTKNIFRVKPANEDEANRIIAELNQGKVNISASDVHDVAFVLLTFFKTLQEPLIPSSVAYSFSTSLKHYKCIRMVETLPNPNRETLQYMIGFLQELITHQDTTKMSMIDLSNLFASCFIRDKSQAIHENLISNTAWVLNCLIDHWDTTSIYDSNSE